MSDLLEAKDVATAMPLRTGDGVNNSVRKVGTNPLFGKAYVLSSIWIRTLSPGLLYLDPSFSIFHYATAGERFIVVTYILGI